MNLYTKRGTRYVPTTLSEQGAWGCDGLMALAAFRYCLGRMTYIVGDCERWIFANWEHFPESVKKLIQRDLEEEFARDNDARARGCAHKPLGHNCDRAAWERVRALCAGEQPPAQPCEPTPAELACRMKWLAAEMDTVGSAMLTQAKSTGDAELCIAGWDLHDAASALLASTKDKT